MPESLQINIGLIDTNDGQIPDVPPNPRYIKADRFEKLKKSITEYPELIQLRELLVYPLNGRYVTISGNMRLRAMRDLAYTQCPCKVLPSETPAKTLRAYVIKENLPYGDNDKDSLANAWGEDELVEFDMPEWELGRLEDALEENSEKEAKKIIQDEGIKVKIFLIHPEDWINQKNRIVNFLQEQSIRFEIVE